MSNYIYSYSVICKPAYNRKYITARHALTEFQRGLNFLEVRRAPNVGQLFSIRDCAPGCVVEIHHGFNNQKATSYTIPNK